MPSNLENLLQFQIQITSQIAYLVPLKWWTQFIEINKKTQSKQQILFPILNLQKFIDTFLLDFENQIVAQLEHKSNYLKFNKILISPQIKKNVQWKFISSQIWKIACAKTKSKFGILTLYDKNNPYQILAGNDLQVQIIFCSKTKSQAFVGFLPEKANVISAIRSIGFQLGFIEMGNSRIIFPDKNPDKPYYYCQLEASSFLQSHDSLFLAYGLQCLQQKNTKNEALDFSFGKGQDQMANSNQANAGDMGVIGIQSFEQVRNDGTMSTGAETPSFFGSQDQNIREFRVRELFRQKTPEQIQQLKTKANKIIRGNLISISELSQEKLQQQSEGIIQDLMQHIHSYKKKIIIHKEKEHLC